MTSTTENFDNSANPKPKISLYDLAKGLTSMGYLVIPVILRLEKDGSKKKSVLY